MNTLNIAIENLTWVKAVFDLKNLTASHMDLIGQLCKKLTVKDWIDIYELTCKKIKTMKKRVTGIGGLFFKSKDPKASKDWYQKHLGFNTDDYGCTFWWKDQDGKDCTTQWSPFKEDTAYFQPSTKEFMFNYRVENLKHYLPF